MFITMEKRIVAYILQQEAMVLLVSQLKKRKMINHHNLKAQFDIHNVYLFISNYTVNIEMKYDSAYLSFSFLRAFFVFCF